MEITEQPIPLQIDADRVVRVGGTRVPLETVVLAFQQGATAEEITQQYPSLALADIYAAISYFLRNEEDVEAYVHRRQQENQHVRKQNEERFGLKGIRERLLARQIS